jgi:hypothetical protein
MLTGTRVHLFLESFRQNKEEDTTYLMGLTSTVSKLFALLCPDKPNFENLEKI